MVGLHTLTMTKASVSEALQEYLQRHMAAGVVVQVKNWKATETYADASVSVEFQQEAPTP